MHNYQCIILSVTEIRMEANPISVILVTSDSKGDRLLFRYPYATDSRQHGEATQIRRRNPYALTIAEDLLQSQPPQTTNIQHGRLTGFTDEVKAQTLVEDVNFVKIPPLLMFHLGDKI